MAEPERGSDLEKMLETAQSRIERLKREKAALRKRCERQEKRVKGFEAAGLPVGSALPVETWMPALPGQDPRFGAERKGGRFVVTLLVIFQPIPLA